MARLASKTGWRAPRLYPESDGAQISFMPFIMSNRKSDLALLQAYLLEPVRKLVPIHVSQSC